MLQGFGGWARFPWAAYVPPSGNVLLAALPGSLAFAGKTATFAVSESGKVGPFSLSVISTLLGFREVASSGAASLTGLPAAFGVSESGFVGRYVLTGIATADMIGEALNPNGAFSIAGISAEFAFAAREQSGSFTQSGIPQALTRDFINWVARPVETGSWDNEGAALPSWTAANSPTSTWNHATAPSVAWSPRAPSSPNWTVDPTQQILPPVSE